MQARGTNAASEIKRVGVIGGGQLAWMMAIAAKPLGMEVMVQTPQADDPAVSMATAAVLAPIDDPQATAQLAQQAQVITFENEFVHLDALTVLQSQGVCFRPSLSALAPLLDKYEQRAYLQAIGLPVPQFANLTPETDLAAAGFEFPLVVKSRRHGYDGQGTFILKQPEDLEQFWEQRQASGGDLSKAFLVEEFIPFERELAVIAARSLTGEIATYPVVETYQQQQVCRWVLAPAAVEPVVKDQVQAIAHRIMTQLEAVGVFGIELFLTTSGKVLVNEIAPRTHNSGHFTLDACATSQFEQHLRAISGLPLGNPQLLSSTAVMVNLLGFEYAQSSYGQKCQELGEMPNTFVHWYGKTQSYPGRKLGHVTVLLKSHQRQAALDVIAAIEHLWYSA